MSFQSSQGYTVKGAATEGVKAGVMNFILALNCKIQEFTPGQISSLCFWSAFLEEQRIPLGASLCWHPLKAICCLKTPTCTGTYRNALPSCFLRNTNS